MDTVIERSAGLDVHQATVVACMVIEEAGHRPKRETRTFPSVRAGLEEMRDWLKSSGVTHVAMEGTGVYWMPVYTTLEETLDVAVVNARHVKNVPGRKTDVSDAMWLAELLRKGLLRKSFARVLTRGEPYKDLGAGYLDARNKPAVARQLVARLCTLGYNRNNILALLAKAPPLEPPA